MTGEKTNYPKVLFFEGFNERDAFEITLKGWFSTLIETEDGKRYSLSFYDPITLQQELAYHEQIGDPCFGEPGLVILPEVTVDSIIKSTQFLEKQGFFKFLIPEE